MQVWPVLLTIGSRFLQTTIQKEMFNQMKFGPRCRLRLNSDLGINSHRLDVLGGLSSKQPLGHTHGRLPSVFFTCPKVNVFLSDEVRAMQSTCWAHGVA